jgi:hypothetical protein
MNGFIDQKLYDAAMRAELSDFLNHLVKNKEEVDALQQFRKPLKS